MVAGPALRPPPPKKTTISPQVVHRLCNQVLLETSDGHSRDCPSLLEMTFLYVHCEPLQQEHKDEGSGPHTKEKDDETVESRLDL